MLFRHKNAHAEKKKDTRFFYFTGGTACMKKRTRRGQTTNEIGVVAKQRKSTTPERIIKMKKQKAIIHKSNKSYSKQCGQVIVYVYIITQYVVSYN